jgi:hypothetical protein
MSQSNKYIVAAVAIVVMVSGVFAYAWLGRSRLTSGSDAELVGRLAQADGQTALEIMNTLSRRGPQALSAIAAEFEKTGDPDLRLVLAETVYRMPPNAATAEALDKMSKLADGTPAAAKIRMFAQDRAAFAGPR